MKKKQLFARLAAFAAATASTLANAALDVTPTGPVGTAITGAQTSGETVGGYVIATVAGLIVIGVIISIVRKV